MTMTATAAPEAAEHDKRFVCDECGYVAKNGKSLGGHMTKHTPRASAAPPVRAPESVLKVRDEVEENVKRLLAQLHEQHDAIERQIAEKVGELSDLRTARQYVDTMIRRLDSSRVRKPKPSPTRSESLRQSGRYVEADRRKRELIARVLGMNDESMTGEMIAAYIAEHKLEPRTSGMKVRALLKEMHDEGVVRGHRVVQGGGMSYKLISQNRGTADAEAQT